MAEDTAHWRWAREETQSEHAGDQTVTHHITQSNLFTFSFQCKKCVSKFNHFMDCYVV